MLPKTWLILRPGLTILGGDARLLAYFVANMVAKPQGGPVLFSSTGDFVLRHAGVRRIAWMAEDVSNVMDRITGYLQTASIKPLCPPPIDYIGIEGIRLNQEQERGKFESTFLAPGTYDVLVFNPLRRAHYGSADAMLRDVRWWSLQFNIAVVAEDPCGYLLAAAKPEDVTLTLEQGPTPRECRLDRHENGSVVLSVPLVDLGDPQGFRFPTAAINPLNGNAEH